MQRTSSKSDANVNSKRHSSTQLWTPPMNFAMVEDNIYRSAYPEVENIPYLTAIGIKTIVLLSIESLSYAVRMTIRKMKRCQEGSNSVNNIFSEYYYRDNNGCSTNNKNKTVKYNNSDNRIRVMQISNICNWQRDGVNSGDDFSQYDVLRAIDLTIDTRWHPILLTCPTGELQTSVVVGCMRRYQYWSLSAIYNECELFSHVAHNLRTSVMTFIASWNPESFPIHACDIVHRHLQLYSKLFKKHTKITPQQTLTEHKVREGHLDNSISTKSSMTTNTISNNYIADETSKETYKEMMPNDQPSIRSSINIDAEHVATHEMTKNKNNEEYRDTECTDLLIDETSKNIENNKSMESVDGSVNHRVQNQKNSMNTHYANEMFDKVVQNNTQAIDVNTTNDCEEKLEDNTTSCAVKCESVTCFNRIIDVYYADWFVNAERYARQREHNDIIYSQDEEVMNVIMQYMESINNEFKSKMLSRQSISEEQEQEQQRHLELADNKMQGYGSKQTRHKNDNEYALERNNEKIDMLLPFIRYAGVRNPPAIDKRSYFTKESLVEDDDD